MLLLVGSMQKRFLGNGYDSASEHWVGLLDLGVPVNAHDGSDADTGVSVPFLKYFTSDIENVSFPLSGSVTSNLCKFVRAGMDLLIIA